MLLHVIYKRVPEAMSMILILNLIHNTVPTEFVIALPEFLILIFRPQQKTR